MFTYKIGDQVRIKYKPSMYYNKVGTVIRYQSYSNGSVYGIEVMINGDNTYTLWTMVTSLALEDTSPDLEIILEG